MLGGQRWATPFSGWLRLTLFSHIGGMLFKNLLILPQQQSSLPNLGSAACSLVQRAGSGPSIPSMQPI